MNAVFAMTRWQNPTPLDSRLRGNDDFFALLNAK
jgi:hypothetical protein